MGVSKPALSWLCMDKMSSSPKAQQTVGFEIDMGLHCRLQAGKESSSLGLGSMTLGCLIKSDHNP